MSESAHGLLFHNPTLSLTVLVLVMVLVLTAYFLRKGRKPEHGHRKGEAADPSKVLRDNPPDA
jgi:hypothetical protein